MCIELSDRKTNTRPVQPSPTQLSPPALLQACAMTTLCVWVVTVIDGGMKSPRSLPTLSVLKPQQTKHPRKTPHVARSSCLGMLTSAFSRPQAPCPLSVPSPGKWLRSWRPPAGLLALPSWDPSRQAEPSSAPSPWPTEAHRGPLKPTEAHRNPASKLRVYRVV